MNRTTNQTLINGLPSGRADVGDTSCPNGIILTIRFHSRYRRL